LRPGNLGGAGGFTSVTGGGGAFGGGDDVIASAAQSLTNGRATFRFDTFGDEAFWGDALKLHQAIAGSANGGVGPGVSPKTALAVGLKVDADAVPADVAAWTAGRTAISTSARSSRWRPICRRSPTSCRSTRRPSRRRWPGGGPGNSTPS
jgi:hypothetical protein